MNGTQSDTDLILRIRDRVGADEAYPVEALLSDGSFFRGTLWLDPIELKAADNDHDVRAYGWHLYERLFTGWIRHAYDLARGIARERSEGRLRVRLWIDAEEQTLHALKWERLYHYHNEQLLPISASGVTAFSRYVGLGEAEPQAIARRPIEMLVAVCNPGDAEDKYGLPAVAVNKEISSLLDALGTLPRQRQMRLTFLLGHAGEEQLTAAVREKLSALECTVVAAATSLDRINRRLSAADIFHFIGHGQFSAQRETTALLLEGEEGSGDWVDDEALISSLGSSECLPYLFFLASCESARREENHPYVGLAAQLVRAGVPAVVAMQESITMPGAQQLAAEFYHRLLRHGTVDRALNAARGQLYNDRPGEGGDWSTPLLFMRLRTGRLFAPDPVQETMEAMAADATFSFFDPEDEEHGHYLPLPVEVVAFEDPMQLRRLDRLDPETTGALDFLPAVQDLLKPQKEEPGQKPLLVGVVGGFGSNKATQLKRLVWKTLQRGLDPKAGTETRPLPIYVDLRNYRPERSAQHNSLERRVLEVLGQFWPDLQANRLSELPTQPLLCLVFYGIDLLSAAESAHTQEQLQALLQTYPQHQYVIAARDTGVAWADFQPRASLHLLVIQPLRRIKVRHFLENLNQVTTLRGLTEEERADLGEQLLDRLYRSQLFDLVATPWFMVKVLLRAAAGEPPASRTDALQKLVEDAMDRLPAGEGMHAHAGPTLSALAWEMQSSQCTALPVATVFATMERIRGNRGYNLETFYKGLRKHNLLLEAGNGSVSFAYEPFRAYCCAQAIVQSADRQLRLDDVTVTLGTPAARRRWEDTLVLVTGLLAQAGERAALCRLLRRLSEGLDLLRGEQLFLVARCFMEWEPEGEEQTWEELVPLRQHVVRALYWRTDSSNEPELRLRVLATQLLSRVAEPEVIIHLAKLVYEKVRTSLSEDKDYEFSSVRMAAAIGLKRIEPPQSIFQILETHFHPSLKPLFRAWKASELDALTEAYRSGENAGVQAVAALALGDVAEQLWAGAKKQEGERAMAFLGTQWVAPDSETPQAVRWALSDALATMNVRAVTETVIMPYLDDLEQRQGEAADWVNRDKCAAYLMGLIRAPGAEVLSFLTDHCIWGSDDMRLWLCAMDALSRLGGPQAQKVLADIATGCADLQQTFAAPDERHALQRTAILLLVDMGDREAIAALRHSPAVDEGALLPSIYRAARAIYWQEEQ